MEIIFNKTMCDGITGKLRTKSHWHLRGKKDRFFALYRGPHDPTVKQQSFGIFYRDLCRLKDAHYIQAIITTDTERRWLNL